jgi:CSLREA domain-containing protein
LTRTLVLTAFIAALLASPATAAPFTVTKTADTNDGACSPGNCSLRDAVIAANAAGGADTINVPAGRFVLTGAAGEDAAASGDLDLTGDTTVVGAGAASTTIDANGIDRIFDIFGSGTQVTLSGMTLTGGQQQFGAAIQTVGAALTLDGVDVLNNSNPPSASGFGAIWDATSGNTALTITNSTFSGSTSGGNGHPGFGVINFGPTGSATVTIKNSMFTANRVGGDGVAGSSGFGILEVGNATTGAITIDGSHFRNNRIGGAADSSPGFGVINYSTSGASSLSITDTDFRDNVVGGGSGGASSSAGFGTVDYGGSTTATFTITRSSFSGNVVGGDGSAGFGGALDFSGGSGTSLTVLDSTFSGNTAGGGGGSGFGGAIDYGGSGTTLSIVNSTLTGNSAGGGGASGFGGAIDFGGATAALNNVTMASNTAGGGGGTGFGGGYDGASTTAVNTIIGDNLSNGASDNCDSVLTSGGHNIENGATCGFTQPGDQNAEPALESLGDFGGPTQTRALSPGSPARDHGAGCPASDQRGQPRPSGTACDVGAYEFTPPGVTTGAATSLTPTSAVLGGSLLASLRPAGFHFDFGKTPAYGSQSASQTANGALSTAAVSSQVTGLTPGTTYHYRLVASGDATVAGADATLTTPFAKPALSRLRLSPSTFRAAGSGGSTAAKRKSGTNITFTDSQASKATFKVLRPAAGRRQGKSCRKPTARNRRGRACTRFVVVGSFSHRDKAGRNKLHFTGRVHRHKLAPGKYRLRVTPRAHGLSGKAVTRPFKIIA